MSDSDKPEGSGGSLQIGGALIQFLQLVYTDFAKPSVVAVGRALGTVVETSTTLALPLEHWTRKRRSILEHNLKKFESEVSQAQDDRKTVIPVPPEIGNPIIERLSYTSDESLSALFIRLLRRASIAEESRLAHPRFVDIISNLSPDEARILGATCEENSFRCLSVRWESAVKTHDGKRERHYYMGERLLCGLERETLILFPENIPKYLTSLQSLGLLQIIEDTFVDEAHTPLDEYEPLLSQYGDIANQGLVKDNFKSNILYGRVEYTEFGKFFLDACVREDAPATLSETRRRIPGRTTTKKIREAVVLEPGKKAPTSRPVSEVMQETRMTLAARIGHMADAASVPKNDSILRRAKILKEMKLLSRADYNGIRDFCDLIGEMNKDLGIDEGAVTLSVKEIRRILARLDAQMDT